MVPLLLSTIKTHLYPISAFLSSSPSFILYLYLHRTQIFVIIHSHCQDPNLLISLSPFFSPTSASCVFVPWPWLRFVTMSLSSCPQQISLMVVVVVMVVVEKMKSGKSTPSNVKKLIFFFFLGGLVEKKLEIQRLMCEGEDLKKIQ